MPAGVDGLAEAGFAWCTRDGATVRAGLRPDGVGVLVLSRPAKGNAWDAALWADWDAAVAQLARGGDVRAVVLCAEGPHFTAGLDLGHLQHVFTSSGGGGGGSVDGGDAGGCPARQRLRLREGIRAMQDAYSRLEAQQWPVIAAVHGQAARGRSRSGMCGARRTPAARPLACHW